MNSTIIKLLLILLISVVMAACDFSVSDKSNTEIIKKIHLTLDDVVKNVPVAITGLAYSSPVTELTSNSSVFFQAQGLPSWANIESHSGRIYGTPGKYDIGTSKVTLSLTIDNITQSIDTSLTVLSGGAYLGSDAVGFYDHQFGGGQRILRNDLMGDVSGEVQFMQSHNVRPNNNFLQNSGDETQSIYSPKLVALRESLVFFIPTNIGDSNDMPINHIDAVISINGEIKITLPMLHPNDTYAADYHGTEKVVFSNQAWSATLPWDLVRNGLSINFIVNKNTASEKSGSLVASAIDIGDATQVIFQSIRLGMLTHFDSTPGHYTLNNPILAATDYFQTIPTSRLVMGSYADMTLDKVIVRSGAIYDEVSTTEGSIYSGDMRGDVAKSQVSVGINLANFGITSNSMNQRYPHLFKQTTNHHAWGNYSNGRVKHGLSGGNGIGTLVDSRGNEASHEWGHGYGMGHYPGAGLTEDQRFKAHHADSGWGYIAHRKRLRDNLIDNAESVELQPATFHLNGRIPYGRDSMSGGSSNTSLSVYTHYTAFTARYIQNHLQQYPLADASFASGYKKWNSELGEYQAFNFPEQDNRLAPKAVGVAVATILGGYDPDGANAVIYPVFHGNYGNVFELPSPDLGVTENSLVVDQCWLTISNAKGEEKQVSIAAKRHDGNSINQFHINLEAEFRPVLAVLNCRRDGIDIELTRTEFDGLIPELPAAAVVGQEAGFKQLKDLELAELNGVFESQTAAEMLELTSQQKVLLDSYTETDIKSRFSEAAYTAYKNYASIQTTLAQVKLLLAKLTQEAASDLEQTEQLKVLLSSNGLLASSVDLPSQGTFIKGPQYFSVSAADNSVVPAAEEEQSASWIMSRQGRIHVAEKPWLCLMPGSGSLVVSDCSDSKVGQMWWHTDEQAFRSQSNNKCVDFDSANGRLIMYSCHYGWNQQWSLPIVSDNKLLALLEGPLIKRLYELLGHENQSQQANLQ